MVVLQGHRGVALKMIRTSRVLAGTVAGAAQTLIAIALQIVLMPLILHTAGQQVVGIYAILFQIVGYLLLFDFGVTSAMARSISQSVGTPARFHSYLTNGFYMLVLAGILYAVVGTALASQVGGLFQLDPELEAEARDAMVLLALWGLFRFPLSAFSAGLVASQDLTVPPLLGAVANALRMFCSLWAVVNGRGLIGLVAAAVLSEALLAGSLLLRFMYLHPSKQVGRAQVERSVLKDLLRFGVKVQWASLASRMIISSDNIVVGMLRGASAASVYYNTQTPVAIPTNLVHRLAENASPGINEFWMQESWQKLRDVFLRLQRVTIVLVAPVVIGGWLYLQSVIAVWVGMQQFAGLDTTFWFVSFALLSSISHVPLMFVYASGQITTYAKITTIEAVANLSLSFLVGAAIGLPGVALATTISHLPTAIYLQRDSHRRLEISNGQWLRDTLRPAVLAVLPLLIAALTLSTFFPPVTWVALGVHALLLGVVYLASAFRLGLTNEEREWIINRLGAVRMRA